MDAKGPTLQEPVITKSKATGGEAVNDTNSLSPAVYLCNTMNVCKLLHILQVKHMRPVM